MSREENQEIQDIISQLEQLQAQQSVLIARLAELNTGVHDDPPVPPQAPPPRAAAPPAQSLVARRHVPPTVRVRNPPPVYVGSIPLDERAEYIARFAEHAARERSRGPIEPLAQIPRNSAQNYPLPIYSLGSWVRVRNPGPSQPTQGVVVHITPHRITLASETGVLISRVPRNLQLQYPEDSETTVSSDGIPDHEDWNHPTDY